MHSSCAVRRGCARQATKWPDRRHDPAPSAAPSNRALRRSTLAIGIPSNVIVRSSPGYGRHPSTLLVLALTAFLLVGEQRFGGQQHPALTVTDWTEDLEFLAAT